MPFLKKNYKYLMRINFTKRRKKLEKFHKKRKKQVKIVNFI